MNPIFIRFEACNQKWHCPNVGDSINIYKRTEHIGGAFQSTGVINSTEIKHNQLCLLYKPVIYYVHKENK